MDVIGIYEDLIWTVIWKPKFLIKGEWGDLVDDIERTFTKVAIHVERFECIKDKQRIFFVIGKHRHVPTNKICHGKTLCKNCSSDL